MIRLAAEKEIANDIRRRLQNTAAAGLIVIDTVDYAGLDRTMGNDWCERIVKSAGSFLERMKEECPAILSVYGLAEDLFVIARIDEQETGLAQQELKDLAVHIRLRLTELLRQEWGSRLPLEVYSGYALVKADWERQLDRVIYKAVKQALRRISLPASLQEDRHKWEHFCGLVRDRRITSVYQPIVSIGNTGIFGYEALTRVPAGSPFQSPIALFDYAESHGALYVLDQLAREKAIEGCAGLSKDQRVFINIPAHVIHDPHFTPGTTRKVLERYGINPHNVVLEITERTSIEDFATAKKILQHYRSQGYQIAIDDAGAGYSSLQAIAELHPDFIKVDRSLIRDIHKDKMKEILLETFVSFARRMGIRIIAEGIEEWEELRKLSQMGVHYGQGYLLGRPSPEHMPLDGEIAAGIERMNALYGTDGFLQIGNLAVTARSFDRLASISEVAQYFREHEDEPGTVILDGDKPVGLIMRERLFQQLAGQYGISLYWNRPVHQLMDSQSLVVEETMPIEQVSQMAMSRDLTKLYDLVIITTKGEIRGIASIRSILEAITQVQVESARIAIPRQAAVLKKAAKAQRGSVYVCHTSGEHGRESASS